MTTTGGKLPEAHAAPYSRNPTPQPGQANPAGEEDAIGDEDPAADEHPIRALTLKAQFAELVASGEKLVENRTWKSDKIIGELLAIHRGGKDAAIVAVARVKGIVKLHEDIDYPDRELARFLALTINAQHRRGHVSGPYCWVLADIVKLQKPIPCKGRLGLWTPDAQVQEQLKAQGLGK
jgi:ASCH domain